MQNALIIAKTGRPTYPDQEGHQMSSSERARPTHEVSSQRTPAADLRTGLVAAALVANCGRRRPEAGVELGGTAIDHRMTTLTLPTAGTVRSFLVE